MEFKNIITNRAGLVKVLAFLESEENMSNPESKELSHLKFGLKEISLRYSSPHSIMMRELKGPAYVVSLEAYDVGAIRTDDLERIGDLIQGIYKGDVR